MELSIRNTKKARSYTTQQVLLVLLTGVLSYYAPITITAVCAITIIYSFLGLAKNRIDWTWYCIAASPGLEVWTRMARAPFIPNEAGKYYLLFAIGLLLIHHIKRHSSPSLHHAGIIILLLLIPSTIASLAYFDMQQWIFNVLGTAELAALLFIASRERWDAEFFCNVLKMALMAILPIVVYISIKNPGVGNIEYNLIANRQTSGGFASNQVSTILGAAILFIIVLQLMNRPAFEFKWLNYLVIAYLLFRGLLTFARGGIIVTFICAIIALLPFIFASLRSFIRYTGLAILFTILSIAIFVQVNNITGNKLLHRYQGETPGTLSGTREKTANTVFAGRPDIIESDLVIFSDNIILGVGAGGSKKMRPAYGYKDQAAHTEFSRLLSEHGIGGLIIVIILIAFPIYWIRKQRIKAWKGILASLFALSVLTSFHSAMRTNVSIVFYALAAIPMFYYIDTKPKYNNEDTLPGQ